MVRAGEGPALYFFVCSNLGRSCPFAESTTANENQHTAHVRAFASSRFLVKSLA